MISEADAADVALLEAALALTDGQAVDWGALRSKCGPDVRGALQCLEELALLSSDSSHSSAGTRANTNNVLALPASWGPLVVTELIGRGSYGDVYRAWDNHLQRHVALKLLRHDRIAEPRLIDEARRLARVHHPNVVTVHGADVISGRAGFWMELIPGGTLASDRPSAARFPIAEIVRVGIDLASALDAVHAAGLLHRDVKPQNVMRSQDGRVLLMDFGAGHDVSTSGGNAMDLAGTPRYMAPEVLGGAPASIASDVYSLGVLLYWLASGDYPVSGGTLDALRSAHERRERTALRECAPRIPKRLATVIDRAVSPDPSRRFASAAEMRDALSASIRHRTTVWVAAAVATLAVASAYLYKSSPQHVVDLSTLVPRDFVLISRFENTTGDSTFDGSVEYLLARELSASKALEVVPGERVIDALQLMKRPLDTVVNRQVAREVAIRDGRVKALIAGRIARDGERYIVTADLIDPADDRTIASLSDHANDSKDVLAAITREAHQIERLYSTHRATIKGTSEGYGISKVSTASLAAIQAYNEALRLFDLNQLGDALTEMDRALLADPHFASAWNAKAYFLQYVPHSDDEMHRAIERAVELSQTAPEWERLFIRGARAWFNGEYAVAVPDFEAVVRLRPQFEPAGARLWESYMLLDAPERGLAALKAAADQRPLDLTANFRAAANIIRLEDNINEAEPYIARLDQLLTPERANLPDFDAALLWTRFLPVYLAWRDGDVGRAIALARALYDGSAKLREPWRSSTRFAAANVFLSVGRLQEFEQDLRGYGDALDLVGSDEARENADNLRQHVASMPPTARVVDVQRLVAAGLIERARARLSLHPRGPDEVIQNLGRAALALHDGDIEGGLHLLQTTIRRPMLPTFSGIYQRGCALLATTLDSRKRRRDAIEELERCIAMPPRYYRTFEATAWMQNELRLADEYRAVGRLADAVRIETVLRRQLAYADADHPLVVRLNAR